MLRIVFSFPRGTRLSYKYLDSVHNAFIAGFLANGISPERAIGPGAVPWTFAPQKFHFDNGRYFVDELIVSTTDGEIARVLATAPLKDFAACDPTTGRFSLEGAVRSPDLDPFVEGMTHVNVAMLSPLVLIGHMDRDQTPEDIEKIDLGGILSASLSRLAGRSIRIEARPDPLYIRGRTKLSVGVNIKFDARNNRNKFVRGVVFPMTLAGDADDLRFAWHSGLGTKTRMGFGAFKVIG